jgi:hypothetical protein
LATASHRKEVNPALRKELRMEASNEGCCCKESIRLLQLLPGIPGAWQRGEMSFVAQALADNKSLMS